MVKTRNELHSYFIVKETPLYGKARHFENMPSKEKPKTYFLPL